MIFSRENFYSIDCRNIASAAFAIIRPDKAYGGTPLGRAKHMQTGKGGDAPQINRYKTIEAYLEKLQLSEKCFPGTLHQGYSRYKENTQSGSIKLSLAGSPSKIKPKDCFLFTQSFLHLSAVVIVMHQSSGQYHPYKQAFHTHYKALCQYAYTFVQDAAACEDMVQEIFVHIWERKRELVETDELRYYLYTAVRNKCFNHLKKVRKSPVKELNGQEYHADHSPEAGLDLSQLVGEALERLPVKCREVFLQSRMNKLTYQQIADSNGISIKTVENQIGKALKIMRSFVREKQGFMLLLLVAVCICCCWL